MQARSDHHQSGRAEPRPLSKGRLLRITLVVFGLVAGAVLVFGGCCELTTSTNPNDYPKCLLRLRRQVGEAAVSHMPPVIPPAAQQVAFFFSSPCGCDGDRTLILKCQLSQAEIDALVARLGPSRLPVHVVNRDIGRDQGVPTRQYYGPDWSHVEPALSWTEDLPDDCEVYLLYEQGPSFETDMTSAGFVVRHRDGMVYFWVHRHWAPFC